LDKTTSSEEVREKVKGALWELKGKDQQQDSSNYGMYILPLIIIEK